MSSEYRLSQTGRLNAATITASVLVGFLALLLIMEGCGGSSASMANNGGNGGQGGEGPVAATVADTVDVGFSPTAIAVDSTTNRIYVVNFPAVCTNSSPNGFGSVAWVDGATNTALGSDNNLPLEFSEPSSYETAGPVAITTDSATNTAYIAMQGHTCFLLSGGRVVGVSSVVAFDGATQSASLISSIPGTPASPGSIAVDANRGKIYLADFSAKNVTVTDLATKSTSILAVPGKTPVAVAVNPTTNILYVANVQNDISVFDLGTGSITDISNTNATAPSGIAVNPSTNTIYMANAGSNNVTVLDGATNLTASFPVGTSPVALGVDSQTNFVYVANAGNSHTGEPGSVSVINGSTNTVATLIDPKAKNPSAVAVNPATNKIYVINSASNNVTVIDGAHE